MEMERLVSRSSFRSSITSEDSVKHERDFKPLNSSLNSGKRKADSEVWEQSGCKADTRLKNLFEGLELEFL